MLSRKVEWEEERNGPRESLKVCVREELHREEEAFGQDVAVWVGLRKGS